MHTPTPLPLLRCCRPCFRNYVSSPPAFSDGLRLPNTPYGYQVMDASVV